MVRKTTSIKMDEEIWKEVKKYCIDINNDISEYLEDLLKRELKKNNNASKKL